MAITINSTASGDIELSDFVELIDKSAPHLTQDDLLAHADHLRMLSNNRRFLVDHIIAELKDIYDFQPKNNYTAQTIMLGGVAGKFYVRANVWLPGRLLHPVNTEGEKRLFSFERAHDHNFDFLTAGYLGRGYETEIYEYDGHCRGELGEKVDLRFLEKTSLPEHKVMLYRAARDIHIQKLPRYDFSISLNLLCPPIPGSEQYIFDLENGTIGNLLRANFVGQRWIIEAAGYLCSDDVSDVLYEIATRHRSEKTRRVARQALAIRWPNIIDH